MPKILVTGGAGFIASALAAALADDPENEVIIVDNFETGLQRNIPQHPKNPVRFIKCDVNEYRDISEVFFAHRFDYVFHYAALVGVQRTLKNPVKVLRDIEGFKNLLNLSKNAGVKRIFFSSSSEVYGEPFEIPQNEKTTPLNSRLPYAIVKNVGEAWLKAYQEEYGLPFTVFRFFNTYGMKQSQDFVISRFIEAALKGEDITVYGDGKQTRTFCYIDDNIEACLKIFRNNEMINDVVNIGSDDEISILELAQLIKEITGSSSKIVHLPPLKEGDMTRRKPDITKMRSILGRDLTPLEKGLSIVANHFKQPDNVRN